MIILWVSLLWNLFCHIISWKLFWNILLHLLFNCNLERVHWLNHNHYKTIFLLGVDVQVFGIHGMKSVEFEFVCLYFPIFGLNTKAYRVNLNILSEYGKIRPTKNYEFAHFPSDIYLLKVNNKNTRARCEIYSELTIKTLFS